MQYNKYLIDFKQASNNLCYCLTITSKVYATVMSI